MRFRVFVFIEGDVYMNTFNLTITILLVIIIVITFILLTPRILYGKLLYNKGKKCDCIIILGYPASIDGKPSSILIERIKKGIELYRSNISPKIICTGGAVQNEHIEAEVMFKELVKNDIPEEDIICEKDSRGTWDNIKNVKKIMESNSFKTAVIVSQSGHIRRASIYATEMEVKHTVEKANVPKGIPLIFSAFIYIHLYYGIMKYLKNKHKYIK
jgi:uncharacterized SAM-binding protein YcdF (DUF218 family)